MKRARVSVALDRRDEAAAKTLARAQQARIDDGEQTPQFVEVVFDRRSRQRNAKMRLEPLSRLSAPRLRVFDRLRLVEDNHAPVDVRQPIRLLMQKPVAEHQDIHRFQASQNVGPSARRAEAPDLEAGGETGQLVIPIVTDRRRRDD